MLLEMGIRKRGGLVECGIFRSWREGLVDSIE